MSRKGNKARKAAANGKAEAEKKKAKGPEVELTPDQQSEQINKTLGQAVSRGMPSAAAMQGMFQLAQTAWNSGHFKTAGGPAGLLVKMMYGHEIGLPPMLSLINIDIVDGHPAMSSQLMSAVFEMAGGEIEWKERSHKAARLVMHYKGRQMDFEFTIEDVNRAQLGGKSNHQKYPKAMMGWRAISDGIKTLAPAVLLKAYTFGELTDDRAHDVSGYEVLADLPLLEGPGAKKDQHVAPQQSTSTTTSTGSQTPPAAKPSVKALEPKIDMIRKLLKSPAVPGPLKDSIESWLTKNNMTDNAAGKALAKLQPFQVTGTSKKSLSPATAKQMTLLRGLSQDPRLSEGLSDWLNPLKETNLTIYEVSAWIACFDWLIGHATAQQQGEDLPEGAEVPPRSPNDRPAKDDNELPFESDGTPVKGYEKQKAEEGAPAFHEDPPDEFADRVTALGKLTQVKVPPTEEELDAVMGWLLHGKDQDESILTEFENQVASWPDKEVVQEDLVPDGK